MEHTGIKATETERDECMALAKTASTTPVIFTSDPRTPDLATSAWDRCRKRCHEIALSHGLPEFDGYYGMTNEGEFVKP